MRELLPWAIAQEFDRHRCQARPSALRNFVQAGNRQKVYKGYMGASGDWVGWESSLTPGPESMRRLELN